MEGTTGSDHRRRPSAAEVRTFFGLPARVPDAIPGLTFGPVPIGVGSGGGLDTHAAALARFLAHLEERELAHQMTIRVRGLHAVQVVVRVHWGMGEWVRLFDPLELIDRAAADALRSLGFSSGPMAEIDFVGRGTEYDWYSTSEDESRFGATARAALAVWDLAGVDDDHALLYTVGVVRPLLTMQEWLDDYCDPELAAEIVAGEAA